MSTEAATLFDLSEMERSATISPCGLYRYALHRRWSEGRVVCFVMLNPSTANGDHDDNTLEKIIRFAKAWGFGGLSVVNLYAYRATDPKVMRHATDPIGPDNDAHIAVEVTAADLVVCGWGNNVVDDRPASVLDVIRWAGKMPHALAVTSKGHPGHPLFLRGNLTPFPLTSN